MIDEEVKEPTTVYLPKRIKQQVKAKGMTLTGAMLAGWEAIQDRVKYAARIEQLEEENRDMGRNIRSMQRMLQENFQKGKQ